MKSDIELMDQIDELVGELADLTRPRLVTMMRYFFGTLKRELDVIGGRIDWDDAEYDIKDLL